MRMKILHSNVSFEILSKADDSGKQNSDALIDWMRAKSTFIKAHGAKEIHLAIQQPPEPPEQPDDHDDDNYEQTHEELLGMDN